MPRPRKAPPAPSPSTEDVIARAVLNPPEHAPGFKVRALRMVFYGHKRRRTGDVWLLDRASDYNPKHMEIVSRLTPDRITTGLEALRAEHDEILRMKSDGIQIDPDAPLDEGGE